MLEPSVLVVNEIYIYNGDVLALTIILCEGCL